VPDAFRNILNSCFDIRLTDDVKDEAPDKVNLKVSF